MEVFPKVIREMVSKFDRENLELMDVNTASKRLNCDSISVQSEVFWHELLHTSIRDSVEICRRIQKKLCTKQAFAFTLPPDKTFILLIDEQGNQLLADSHVHYTDDNQTL